MKKSHFLPLLLLMFMVCSMTTAVAQSVIFKNQTNCDFNVQYKLGTPNCMALEAITRTATVPANSQIAVVTPPGLVLAVVSGAPSLALPGCNFLANLCTGPVFALIVNCANSCFPLQYKVTANNGVVRIF